LDYYYYYYYYYYTGCIAGRPEYIDIDDDDDDDYDTQQKHGEFVCAAWSSEGREKTRQRSA